MTLKNSIVNMYPEIGKHSISVTLAFSKENHAYIMILKKNTHLNMTPIKKEDADKLMDGFKCDYLDSAISQFIKNVK